MRLCLEVLQSTAKKTVSRSPEKYFQIECASEVLQSTAKETVSRSPAKCCQRDCVLKSYKALPKKLSPSPAKCCQKNCVSKSCKVLSKIPCLEVLQSAAEETVSRSPAQY
ncbi:hypothetical protein Bpfe_006639 [Biomphalaria pfeifferi]|uniref:Uncharacterized protein n=1 Tax=Biomphalaria pfeifferi TaxID=112525 RepID=A0AAD8C209_BIOPF|nr:hypothetical protein Bpfe_006639 [Biomphalaria pfeifferi]